MATLVVDARGRITLCKELLQHLDVEPGGKIEIVKLPHGRIEIRAAKTAGRISDAFGMLKRTSNRTLTVEQINGRTAKGKTGHR